MPLPDANLRSLSYFIAETRVPCAHCAGWTRVLALGMPPNHELLADDDWQSVAASAFIFHVTALPDTVQRELQIHSSSFRCSDGADASSCSWLNHCEHCDRPIGDDELHCEPGGFMPGDADQAAAIVLSNVPQPFCAVAAGHAPDPEFFGLMRVR
jgi:hypothetical protein